MLTECGRYCVTLFFLLGVMKYNPQQPVRPQFRIGFPNQGSRFRAVCCALICLTGSTTRIWLPRQLGSRPQGHPDCHACPGIEVCSGLWSGLGSFRCSSSLSAGRSGSGESSAKKGSLSFCGDGELRRGFPNREACMFAAHRKTDNLTAIVDLTICRLTATVTARALWRY